MLLMVNKSLINYIKNNQTSKILMHDLYIFLFTEWKVGNIHVLCVVEDHLYQNVVLPILSQKIVQTFFFKCHRN